MTPWVFPSKQAFVHPKQLSVLDEQRLILKLMGRRSSTRTHTHTYPLMSLLIRYSPMASYFWLSIIFLTPQILQHISCQHDLPWDSCDHHQLYPIPTTPSVIYLGCDKDQWRCGSEGCDLGAVKWSPDAVSRSVKWCETEVRYGAIRRRVSGVWDRAKVQRCKGAKVERSEMMRRDKLESEFWGKLPCFSE